jgi:epidermal growth factor receptor substrate 15
MTLKPLGLKDSLIQPYSLGQNFDPLGTPFPLARSLTPLGSSQQPLGNSVIQPLLEVNEDWEIGNWQLDAGMQVGEDGEGFAGRISRFSDDQLSISSRSEINLKAGETLPSQDFGENYFTDSGGENESLSSNAGTLNASNAATNNITQLKPLGISEPLVQTSSLEISNLSELSQFTESQFTQTQFTQEQSTSSSGNFGTVSGETSSLSDPKPIQRSDLPKISTLDNRSLGFNERLISPFIAEPLPQSPTSFPEKLNLSSEDSSPSLSNTDKGEVERIAPDSLNLTSPKISPLLSQEAISLQSEPSQEQQQDLTVQTEVEGETGAPILPNLIQSKPAPAPPQELAAAGSETIVQKIENSSDRTERSASAIDSSSSNLIQAKSYLLSSQETDLLLPEINEEQQGLTAKPERQVEASVQDSSNLIQAQNSSLPTQERVSLQLETSQEKQNLTVKTESELEENSSSSSNLIQSQPAPVPSQELTPSQPETIVQKTEDLSDTTGPDVGAIVPDSPHLITAQKLPKSPQQTYSLQLETIGKGTENFTVQTDSSEAEESAANSSNSIQAQVSLAPDRKTVSPQLETSEKRAQNFTTQIEPDGDASASNLPNVIQSQTSPVSSQEANLVQLKTSDGGTEGLAAQTDGEEIEENSADLSNSIQPKVSLATQETVSPQLETSQERAQDFTGFTKLNVEASASNSPNAIQSKTSPVSSQEANLGQLETIGKETEGLAAQTDGEEVEENTADLSNSIQPKVSLATQETVSPQLETSQERAPNFTAQTEPDVEASASNYTNAIQSKTSAASSQEAGSLQLESIGEEAEDFYLQTDGDKAEESAANLSDSILIQASSAREQETVSLQLETSQERAQHLINTTESDIGAINSDSPTLIQSKSSPLSSGEADLLQIESIGAATEILTAQAADSSNSIQTKVSLAPIQETASPQLEASQERAQDFTDSTEPDVEASALNSPNAIQSQTSPTLSQEAGLVQLETIGEETEEVVAQTDGESAVENSANLSNSIQAKVSPVPAQETASPQLEIRQELAQDFTGKVEPEVGDSLSSSPNLIQAKNSPASSQEAGLLQLKSLGEETDDFTTQNKGIKVEENTADLSNSVQAKVSSVPPQETISPQLETSEERAQNLTAQTNPDVGGIASNYHNAIQSQTSPASSQEAGSLQLELIGEEAEHFSAQTNGEKVKESTGNLSNSIQAQVSPLPDRETVSPQLEASQERSQDSTDSTVPDVGTLAPDLSNSIQAQVSSATPQETVSPQLETIQERSQDFTNTTESNVGATTSESSNLIQAKSSPALSQEAGLLQLELLSEKAENLTSQTDVEEVARNAVDSSSLIQTKVSTTPIQETALTQLETSQKKSQDFTDTIEPEVGGSASSSSNLIQAKTSPAPSQKTELLQLESLGAATEDFTPQTTGIEAAKSSADLSKSIQTKVSNAAAQEIVSLQLETSHEQQDLTAKSESEITAIAPASGNLTQVQLSLGSLSETTGEQQENLTAQSEGEVEAIAPSSPNRIQSKTSSTPSEAIGQGIRDLNVNTIVQGRLDSQNLNFPKPLGNSIPFAKMSDLFLSNFITDAANKPPTFSQDDSRSSDRFPPNISKNPESYFSNIAQQTDLESPQNNMAKVDNIPNSWSSISELLGENTNKVTTNIDSLKPLGFSQEFNNTNNLMWPNLQKKHINKNEQQNNTGFDTPTSWSNISELLGESYTATSDSIQTKEQVTPAPSIEQESSPSYTLLSPDRADNTAPTANTETSQTIGGSPTKKASIDDEQLEHLAQKVYTLMRQWLEIEQERHGNQSVGSPIWLSNITSVYGTSAKVKSAPKRSTSGQQPANTAGEISPTDDKFQKLTREIYYLTQQRLEIEQERQGGYRTDRLF